MIHARLTLDLVCDDPSGLNFCPANSDCFDCDPFQQFRDQGCDACVSNGGRYCETAEGTPVCSAPDIAATAPNACSGGGGTPYMSTCSGTGTPTPPTGGDCDLLNDPCQFALDLECDDPSGLNFCPANSDCFDCDPFQQFRDQGCDACVSNGGRYCETAEGTPVCSAPDIAATAPNACSGGGGTPYMSTCTGTGTPTPPTGGDCDLLNDPCQFALDLECDDPSGLNFCPANSDCFDCDPFQQFRDQGCDACVSNGGRYCETAEGTPVCSAPDIAATAPNACSGGGGTPYMSTCSGTGTPTPPTGSDCDLLNDACQFALDLECDAGTFCPGNSDCFDCDPFQQFRDQGCNACVSNGGRYCETAEGIPVCSSPDIAAMAPNACSGGGGTPFMSTCSTDLPPPASPTDSPAETPTSVPGSDIIDNPIVVGGESTSGSPSKFVLAWSVAVAVISAAFLAVPN